MDNEKRPENYADFENSLSRNKPRKFDKRDFKVEALK